MKKLLSAFLSMTLILALAACGGDGGGSGAPAGKEAPDLNQFYEDFMTSLGEDNQPAMMDVEADLIPQVYPGLEDYELKQSVLKTPMISSVAFEIALVELADASKAQEVADIFQARIDYQVETGASRDRGELGEGTGHHAGQRGCADLRRERAGPGCGGVQQAVCLTIRGHTCDAACMPLFTGEKSS